MQSLNRNKPDETGNDKWVETLTDLLELSVQANAEFDYERSLRYLASMEELWESKGLPSFSPELRLGLHNEKGKALSKLGRYAEAVEEYQKLLEYCQENKMTRKRLEVFLEIGQLLAKCGEHDRALGFIHRSLSGYRRINNPEGICKSLRNLGVIYIELGEFEDAVAAYEEAINTSGQNSLNLIYADLYNNLGAIKNIQGNWKKALECYNISKDVYEREKEIRKLAYTLNNIGITFFEQGQTKNAKKYFLHAYKTAGAIKDESLLLIININMADLSHKEGDLQVARQYCLSAERYLVSNHLKNGQLVETKKIAGKIATAEKDFDGAMEYFDKALSLCEELGLQYMEAEVLFEKGNLLFVFDRHMESLLVLENAIQIYNHLDAAGRVEQTKGLINSIEELYLKVFDAMASRVDRKDSYTKGHSDRVASLSMHLAVKLGLSENEIKTIVAGALLHDIGKIEITDEILKKPGRLTSEEFDEIKKHPEAGVRLLSKIKLPWDIMPLIRFHHEKFDGNGYPNGLKGDMIPLGARIICVTDVFDALTSARPYREAFSAEKALQIMKREMSAAFDSVMLHTLDELIRSGKVDHIVNRSTDPDEMYKIWALCQKDDIRDSQKEERMELIPVS